MVKKHIRNRGKNYIFAELGGVGYFYSLNYERRLFNHYLARVGFSKWSLKSNDNIFNTTIDALIFPVSIATTLGNKSSMLEIGGGISYIQISANSTFQFMSDESTNSGFFYQMNLSFRGEPSNLPLMYKIGFTPILSNNEFYPWVSVCIGVNY
ncbi:MAG: hypothetical protein K8S23_11470 [Candidatus Cloacimonetes bacterium]|nr:hypothetical protein [Candidatus Cloacimonadota bacterium]